MTGIGERWARPELLPCCDLRPAWLVRGHLIAMCSGWGLWLHHPDLPIAEGRSQPVVELGGSRGTSLSG